MSPRMEFRTAPTRVANEVVMLREALLRAVPESKP